MANIIIVCTANICRSPVAEAVLRDRLQARGLDGWQISSAGTWALTEREASRFSIQVMAEEGLDISRHQAQMIKPEHLEMVDLVLCMEAGHAEALRVEFPGFASKITLLSEMVGRQFSISDPYGQPIEMYRQMAANVIEIIDDGLERIVELAEENARQRP